MLSPSLGLGGYCRQHMQSEVERARTTSRLIMGKLLHNRNGRYPLSPLRKYIIPWFCLQSHIHWLLVAKWDRRIQPLILAWWPGLHTTPSPFECILVAGLLQTQIQKLLWILQIFPYNSQQTLTPLWPTARHSVLVNVSMLECIGLAVLLCIWVWKHVEMIYLCDCV